jgi:hypothetical protein
MEAEAKYDARKAVDIASLFDNQRHPTRHDGGGNHAYGSEHTNRDRTILMSGHVHEFALNLSKEWRQLQNDSLGVINYSKIHSNHELFERRIRKYYEVESYETKVRDLTSELFYLENSDSVELNRKDVKIHGYTGVRDFFHHDLDLDFWRVSIHCDPKKLVKAFDYCVRVDVFPDRRGVPSSRASRASTPTPLLQAHSTYDAVVISTTYTSLIEELKVSISQLTVICEERCREETRLKLSRHLNDSRMLRN